MVLKQTAAEPNPWFRRSRGRPSQGKLRVLRHFQGVKFQTMCLIHWFMLDAHVTTQVQETLNYEQKPRYPRGRPAVKPEKTEKLPKAKAKTKSAPKKRPSAVLDVPWDMDC